MHEILVRPSRARGYGYIVTDSFRPSAAFGTYPFEVEWDIGGVTLVVGPPAIGVPALTVTPEASRHAPNLKRHVNATPMTPAERAQAYRQRKKAKSADETELAASCHAAAERAKAYRQRKATR